MQGSILITGGAGFIGSHLAEDLLATGRRVVVLDDLRGGRRSNVPPGSRFVEADLEWRGLADLLREERVEIVSHHAAQSNVRTSVASPVDDARTNILGSLALLDACVAAGVRRVVFASSGGTVYGVQHSYPCDEDHPTAPISPYGCSKLALEHYLLAAQRRGELDPTILRYANVYGPRQDPKGEAGIVAILFRTLLAGNRPRIFGDGSQTRDYIHVADVVRLHRAVIEQDATGVFNVGTGIETRLDDLMALVADILDRPELTPIFEPFRTGELLRNSLSPRRLEQAIGARAEVDLRDGLRQCAEWFRDEYEGKGTEGVRDSRP